MSEQSLTQDTQSARPKPARNYIVPSKAVLCIVSKHTGVPKEEILGPSVKRRVAFARHATARTLYVFYKKSPDQIARALSFNRRTISRTIERFLDRKRFSKLSITHNLKLLFARL